MLRIATFNVENLEIDDQFEKRAPILRSQLDRLNAHIVCLQEVHDQTVSGVPSLAAVERLIQGTRYESFGLVSTLDTESTPRSGHLAVLADSRFEIDENRSFRNDLIGRLEYKHITAMPFEDEPSPVIWDRPILYTRLRVNDQPLHLITLHLKSRIPSTIEGQKETRFSWKTSAGWAEGYFLSSMKRVGQALETRILVDQIFAQDKNARIVVCGDFNADPEEVPVEAIAGRIENTGNPDLSPFVLIPCSHTVPDSHRYTLFHHGSKRLLDHMLISRALVGAYRHTEIHNELLHDETIAFATDQKFPESDHAPFVAEFGLDA
jgi:endonuclease/exonuclease/phosphatase family metal-dependent hydrolase